MSAVFRDSGNPAREIKKMKHLFSEWKVIREKIEGGSVYLMLDFDGTLTAIRRDPDKARLSGGAVRILKRAARTPGIDLSIISGRSLKDIRKRVGIEGLTYAGNHGLEIQGPGIKFSASGPAKIKRTMSLIAGELRGEFRKIKGVIIEHKGLTVSVHFRMVKSSGEGDVEEVFKRVTAPYVSKKKIMITPGKKIWEVRPPVKWDKGRTVLFLLEKKRKTIKKILPIYLGDDRTDEDAFKAIGNTGICVFVGRPGRSAAPYYLRGAAEARGFIRRVTEMKKGERR